MPSRRKADAELLCDPGLAEVTAELYRDASGHIGFFENDRRINWRRLMGA